MSMRDDTDKFVKFLGWMALAAFLFITVPWLNGWTLSVMWSWFVQPVLPVGPLGTWQAAGLYLTMAWVARQVDPQEDTRHMSVRVAELYIHPLVLLAVGYVIHEWVMP